MWSLRFKKLSLTDRNFWKLFFSHANVEETCFWELNVIIEIYTSLANLKTANPYFFKLFKNTCVWVSLLKKRVQQKRFLVSFAKFLKTPFLSEHLQWLLLLFWLWNHVLSQQQKNKVRFVGSLCCGVAGGPGEASSFGWFLGGFRWFLLVAGDIGWFQGFAVLVVTRISRHSEELFLYCTHEHTWLTEVIRVFYSNQDSKKKIITVLSPSVLKISDYFLYSVVLFPILLFPILYSMSDKKLLLKKII